MWLESFVTYLKKKIYIYIYILVQLSQDIYENKMLCLNEVSPGVTFESLDASLVAMKTDFNLLLSIL